MDSTPANYKLLRDLLNCPDFLVKIRAHQYKAFIQKNKPKNMKISKFCGNLNS